MQDETDWVRARARCRMDSIFEDLKRIVKDDVDAMGEVGWSRRRFVLKGSEEGSPTFQIQDWPPDSDPQQGARGYNVPGRFVDFTRDGENIRIDRYKDTHKYESTSAISYEWDRETLSCKLKMDGQFVELWQVSEKVLYPMFFGE